MYSRCRIEYAGPVLLGLAVLLLSGCERGSAQAGLPVSQVANQGVIGSALIPGMVRSGVTEDPRAAQYYDNADAVGMGKRLFAQFNCNGCHSSGGGGMGPSLMDNQWIYGGRLAQIHQTLVVGRPNGMPAWGGKIPDEQLWQIAAYVRSLSLPATLAADHSDTPGQQPAPVPRDADDHAGWSPPPDTTNDFTSVITGPGQ
jgi:cytochrome c oxidase cbb3-type subunit III